MNTKTYPPADKFPPPSCEPPSAEILAADAKFAAALSPAPTAEEIQQAEFEAAYREEWERCEGLESEWKFDLRIFARDEQGRYVAQGVEPSWRMWKKARAAKEGKA